MPRRARVSPRAAGAVCAVPASRPPCLLIGGGTRRGAERWLRRRAEVDPVRHDGIGEGTGFGAEKRIPRDEDAPPFAAAPLAIRHRMVSELVWRMAQRTPTIIVIAR